jgi:hypothetical protein
LARAAAKFGAQRPGIAALVHLLQAVVALLGTFSVYWWAGQATNRLALPLDFDEVPLLAWARLVDGLAPGVGLVLLNLVWIVPFVWIVASAIRVGAAFAAAHGGRGVRDGMGRYGWQGVGLASLVLLIALVWVVAAFVLASLVDAVMSGASDAFWSAGVALPVLLFGGWALLAFAHDHARCAVALGTPVFAALRAGLAAVGRDGPSVRAGVVVLLGSWALWLLPSWIDTALPGASPGGFWLAFGLAQLVLFVRTWVEIGWLGGIAARHVELRADEASWLSLRLPRPTRRATDPDPTDGLAQTQQG